METSKEPRLTETKAGRIVGLLGYTESELSVIAYDPLAPKASIGLQAMPRKLHSFICKFFLIRISRSQFVSLKRANSYSVVLKILIDDKSGNITQLPSRIATKPPGFMALYLNFVVFFAKKYTISGFYRPENLLNATYTAVH